jgi:hypothetical protein
MTHDKDKYADIREWLGKHQHGKGKPKTGKIRPYGCSECLLCYSDLLSTAVCHQCLLDSIKRKLHRMMGKIEVTWIKGTGLAYEAIIRARRTNDREWSVCKYSCGKTELDALAGAVRGMLKEKP